MREMVSKNSKNFLALLSETLNELKQPQAWVDYSKKAFLEVAFLFKAAMKSFSIKKIDLPFVFLLLAIFFFLAVVLGII
ncbi:MAG: hypothetical protein HYW50_04020 [Candidatus Diapherotrites archaeon]|nr:hypothetical protein [Candidatus Diapherotrites archaeon]